MKSEIDAKLLKEISKTVDTYYKSTESFGESARQVFGSNKKSQIRNLESIAYSTSKLTDIYDFIKNQTGKAKENREWRKDSFGKDLLNKLIDLRKDAKAIFNKLDKEDHDLIRIIHLRLIRNFIKQLSAHYLYALAEKEG